MSGASGIGFFVWDAYNAGNLDFVIAAIVIIGFVGLVLDALFLKLGRKVTLEVRR
jgi:nitrate/nitrite transport system permease protein